MAVTERGEEIRRVISKVEKQPRRSGGIRSTTPYESQLVPADDSRERRSTGLLNIYYDAVIACIRDAESILIFGPGEAKGELKKRLQRNNKGKRAKNDWKDIHAPTRFCWWPSLSFAGWRKTEEGYGESALIF